MNGHENAICAQRPPYTSASITRFVSRKLAEEGTTAGRDDLPDGRRCRCREGKPKNAEGYYNIERMLKRVLAGNGKVLLCGTCMDARGLDDAALLAGVRRSTMDELATVTADADKVLSSRLKVAMT